jgi:E3 ubiquitin-protein ligase RNF19A
MHNPRNGFSSVKTNSHLPNSQRLEVQADVSSETASAVTCVSEKSGGNISNDTASSVRALAGSILNYKSTAETNANEDGDRVRFDSNVYMIDDHLMASGCPEKASLGSGRSFRSERSFRDDLDSSSLCSVHKRLAQRIPKLSSAQHRTLSVDSGASNNIPEQASLEQLERESLTPSPAKGGALIVAAPDALVCGDCGPDATDPNKPIDIDEVVVTEATRNLSKSNILRNLFFFQNESGSSTS